MFTRIGRISLFPKCAALVSVALFCACGEARTGDNQSGGSGGAAGASVSAVAGAPADECSANADCSDSAAAQALAGQKCSSPEVYCLEGRCEGRCGEQCEVVRTDVNPCNEGICAPSQYGAFKNLSFCTMLPVACATSADCPKYLPAAPDGAAAQWSCEGGVCSYPGFEFATH
jgi:hypothetical protein